MSSANITVDPVARETAVEHPEITEVRSTRFGLILDARQYIVNQRYDRLIRSRNLIREGNYRGVPRLTCAICGVPVYLVSSKRKARLSSSGTPSRTVPARHKRAASGLTTRLRQ